MSEEKFVDRINQMELFGDEFSTFVLVLKLNDIGSVKEVLECFTRCNIKVLDYSKTYFEGLLDKYVFCDELITS